MYVHVLNNCKGFGALCDVYRRLTFHISVVFIYSINIIDIKLLDLFEKDNLLADFEHIDQIQIQLKTKLLRKYRLTCPLIFAQASTVNWITCYGIIEITIALLRTIEAKETEIAFPIAFFTNPSSITSAQSR